MKTLKNKTIEIKTDSNFYISSLRDPNPDHPSILFIHGGPGNNSEIFELFCSEREEYQKAKFNLFFYDQRGCARSTGFKEESLTHQQNVDDIKSIITQVEKTNQCKIKYLLGHSYGARLAYDFVFRKGNLEYHPIFIGMCHDFKIQRTRSFVMDTLNIKLNQPEVFNNFANTLTKMKTPFWENADKTREFIQDSNFRTNFYWGNPNTQEIFENLKGSLTHPYTNIDTFRTVRNDLYENKVNFLGPKTDTTDIKYLWINGIFDFLMAGETLDIYDKGIKTFFESGHYPHIEQPQELVKEIESFMEITL